jgi:hypothetical protein
MGYVIETEEQSNKNTIYKLIGRPAPQQLSLV